MRISDWSSDVCSSDLLRLGINSHISRQKGFTFRRVCVTNGRATRVRINRESLKIMKKNRNMATRLLAATALLLTAWGGSSTMAQDQEDRKSTRLHTSNY